MDVFVAGLEDEVAFGQLPLHLDEGGEKGPALLVGEQARPLQAEHMGPAAGDVVGRQPAVERKALGERKELR